jgi:Reverse transcriptase (RNA-dependent DNA polymerase)
MLLEHSLVLPCSACCYFRIVVAVPAIPTKTNENGEMDRYKARLVIRGFEQTWGVDFARTFAPVAMYASIRILFAIAAVEDLKIRQMDVFRHWKLATSSTSYFQTGLGF